MHTEGGRDIFLLTASLDQAFQDGHHELDGVRLEFYGKKTDRNDVITADHAIYDDAKAFSEFHDNVNVTMSDGAIIKTDAAHYDMAKKVVTSDSVVHFERQNVAGSFKGMFFDTVATKLLMKNDVNIRLAARENAGPNSGGPVTIKSANGEYEKSISQMLFSGKVSVDRDADQMLADKMTAFLSPQNKIERLEARGNSYMKLAQRGKAFEVKSRDFDFHVQRSAAA